MNQVEIEEADRLIHRLCKVVDCDVLIVVGAKVEHQRPVDGGDIVRVQPDFVRAHYPSNLQIGPGELAAMLRLLADGFEGGTIH